MDRRRSRRSAGHRQWVVTAGWVGVACLATLAGIVALLPTPRPTVPVATVLYDRNDQPVAHLTQQNRTPVPLGDVPSALQQAVLAAEDRAFYKHHGVNPAAILRAAWIDVRARRVVEGGSTITQQLAKTLFLTPSRTLTRKLAELLYTFKLEAVFSKGQILELYLNSIYLGAGAYGVEAASETYFGTPVHDLDLAQAALIAGLIRGPELYNPLVHPRAALARRNEVLDDMVAAGFISRQRAAAASGAPLSLAPTSTRPPEANHFAGYVLAQLSPRLENVDRGGYRVYTTLDSTAQAAADAAVDAMPPGKPDAHGSPQPQVALVAIDPTSGAIRAMVGARDYRHDTFNRAALAHRQPGSAFKPFLYAAVFDEGYTTVDRQYDGPVSFPGAGGQVYQPTDYGAQPYLLRDITVREAVAISDNVVAVKWASQIGPRRVIDMARRAGITSPLQPTLPLVLGTYEVTPLELADAYVPFANLGMAYPAWAVRRVEDAYGNVVWQPRPPEPRQAMDPGVAYLVTSVLESVMQPGGTGAALPAIVGGRPLAGKTGTTNDSKDAWFVGYTPDLVAAVWVGDDAPAPLPGYGSSLAGPVWAQFMAGALASVPASDWTPPDDVIGVPVSALDGLLPNPTSPAVNEVFLRGTEPRQTSPLTGSTGPAAEGGSNPGSASAPVPALAGP